MNQRPTQIGPVPQPHTVVTPARKFDVAEYDKPVMLATVNLTKTVRVAVRNGDVGGAVAWESKDFFEAARGFVLELHLRQRILRIWSTQMAKAPVVNVLLGGAESWTLAGEVGNVPAPEGPKAA